MYSVKLKLEFIVLNQLQSLVKRGLTPGLGLRSNLSHIASSSDDSRGSEPSPQRFTAPKSSQLPAPTFDRGFITKAGAALNISTPKVNSVSSSESGSESDKRTEKSDGSLEDEHDLKNVLGRPDGDEVKSGGVVDDIERQYLGRWNGTESRS